MSTTESKLVTPDELAARLQVKRTTIFQWVREGKFPAIKLSRRVVRFDLDRVLQSLGVEH